METALFKNRKVNVSKLINYGFKESSGCYIYSTDIAENQFCMRITISDKRKISTKVTDKTNGEEYILHRTATASGAFVGMVRADYEAVLADISEKCFDIDVFKSNQAKQVISYVRDKYGNELEYLWKKFPNDAIWRKPENNKWYGVLLTVPYRKLGIDSDGFAEIIDLKLDSEQIEKLVDNNKFFPGYHMNKNHWITICLNDSVETDIIFSMIDNSYSLAQ